MAKKKGKTKSKKGASALKQIVAYAHKIQDKHPKTPWKEAIKEGSKKYRSKK